MKGKPVHFLAVAAAALLALAAPASATHVQCGDVITETTVLDSDLVCPTTEGDTGYVALTIAASDVTLWMNKHTIRSQGGYGRGIVVPDAGYRNIQIRNGRLEGWSPAIHIDNASDSAVLKVTVAEPGAWKGSQIAVTGDRNYVARNVVVGYPAFPDPPDDEPTTTGIAMSGDDSYTWGNSIRNAVGGTGIWSRGDRQRHVLNRVEGCVYAIYASGYTTGAVINRNVVDGCVSGIWVLALNDGGGARIRLNQVTGVDEGFWITDSTAIVGRNVSNGNGWGIISWSAGTTIQYNTTNDNAFEGIYAAEGTIDGGGNTATGNGATPQCVNVQCSSP
jgi:hypothetical protein